MVSIVILTKNEEADLPGCLSSVGWSDDVHVVDSGSIDRTIEIARQHDATITTNSFQSFGKQRNFAIDTLSFKYEWILFLDADEVITEKFHQSMIKSIQAVTDEVAGFYCCWKMMLEGKWLRFSDNFPKWQFRLLRKGRARFTDFGHGQKEHEVAGKIGYIAEPYIHYGFSKGWYHWIERHNKYSNLEALDRLNSSPPLKNVFNRHQSVRNPALKSLLTGVPGWPFLRFIYSYVLRFGFLEGVQGFVYCSNMAYYEFLIQIKVREIKRKLKEKLSIEQ